MSVEKYISDNKEKILKEYEELIITKSLNYKMYYYACLIEQNVKVLEQIVKSNNIKNDKTGLLFACEYNTNLEIIWYLYRNKKKINMERMHFILHANIIKTLI